MLAFSSKSSQGKSSKERGLNPLASGYALLKSQPRTGHTRGKGPGKNTADENNTRSNQHRSIGSSVHSRTPSGRRGRQSLPHAAKPSQRSYAPSNSADKEPPHLPFLFHMASVLELKVMTQLRQFGALAPIDWSRRLASARFLRSTPTNAKVLLAFPSCQHVGRRRASPHARSARPPPLLQP